MHAFRLAKSLKFHSPFLCLLFQKQVSNFQANETIVQSKTYYDCNNCSYNHFQYILIWSFSDFSLLLYFVQSFSFRKGYNLFVSLNIVVLFHFSTFKAQYIVITKRIPNGINASRSNQKNNGTADKRVITRCTVKMLPLIV